MYASVRSPWASAVRAALGLVLLCSIANAMEYKLTTTTPDPDNRLNRNEENGGEKLSSSASVGSFTWSQSWKDGGAEIAHYSFTITFTAPPKRIVAGEPVSLELKVSASSGGKPLERPTELEGRFDIPGDSVARAKAGQPPGGKPFVGNATGSYTFKARNNLGAFDIVATATGWGAVTVYHYEPVKPGEETTGTTTPTTPPTTPQAPVEPPPSALQKVAPTIQLSLGTARYLPSEPLVYTAVVNTGRPRASRTSPAELTMRVTGDNSGSDLLWMFAAAGARKEFEGPSAPAQELSEATRWVVNSLEEGPLCGQIRAPAQAGAYCLQASVVTQDNRTAEAVAYFDVMSSVRRLVIHPPGARVATLGSSPQITVPFKIDGIAAGQPLPTVRAWGIVEYMTLDDFRQGKGFRWGGALTDREAVPELRGKGTADGKVEWNIRCDKEGMYRATFTVTAPYYGTREGHAQILAVTRERLEGLPGSAATTTSGGQMTTTTGGGATPTLPPAATGGGQATMGGATTGIATTTATLPIQGLDMTLGMQGGKIIIASVGNNSWASNVGIQPGWQLTKVDGADVAGMTLAQVKTLLTPANKPIIALDLLKPDGGTARILVPITPPG
jgi:hypothetical protein